MDATNGMWSQSTHLDMSYGGLLMEGVKGAAFSVPCLTESGRTLICHLVELNRHFPAVSGVPFTIREHPLTYR